MNDRIPIQIEEQHLFAYVQGKMILLEPFWKDEKKNTEMLEQWVGVDNAKDIIDANKTKKY